ncbi:unnamed protein product [Bubo scandiacus]
MEFHRAPLHGPVLWMLCQEMGSGPESGCNPLGIFRGFAGAVASGPSSGAEDLLLSVWPCHLPTVCMCCSKGDR